MPIKLKKTLYVGIGGTGADTLLEVKKCFIDSYGEIPPMIGFIVIDTDGAATNKSRTSNTGKDIKLLLDELFVCTVNGALNVYRANQNEYKWVPQNNVTVLGRIQGGGAGQVRSNGRFIAYFNRNKIQIAISSKLDQINAPLPVNSKYEVDMNANGIAYPININVVSSIAGGTGSGMLIDVLCLINEVVGGINHRLYPWIVLPEIFRAMNAGPSMDNVYYNTYGALRELDYIMHYDPKNAPINLGYTTINDRLFDYAYLINNKNLAGTTFSNIGDLTEVIAKSMFLPANEMGNAITTPFDNIMVQCAAGTYDIREKSAWAATASSAELLYDGQSVGRAYAYQTIWQLCESMMSTPSNGTADANAFVSNVEIQEHLKDDITDFLLSNKPRYVPEIDESTTIDVINAYLNENRESSLADELNVNMDKKLAAATKGFNEKIDEIMSRPKGKVGAAIQFIDALQNIMDLCKKEMDEEKAYFQSLNTMPMQWDVKLNAVKTKGIASLFKKTDSDQIEELQNNLSMAAVNIREEIRRNWALKFYAQFDKVIANKLKQLQGLASTLHQISKKYNAAFANEQHRAQTDTLFQVFLHKNNVMSASDYVIDDNIKADFLTFLGAKGASSWLAQSKEYIDGKLWDFAKGTSKVMEAVNTTIDQVLQQMKPAEVKKYLERIKNMASPLWTYDYQGFNSQAATLDSFVIVGVGNRNTSILATDPAYKGYFDLPSQKASFASTHQDDRIYVLVVEDLLPVYAVNSFKTYESDHRQKLANKMVNYIDELLDKRINNECFSVVPVQDNGDVLKYWVYGFVFGYINYDKEKNTYWIRSKKKGNAIKKYRHDLGKQRDEAYRLFKDGQLYDEVKTALDNEIERNGIAAIDSRLQEIKNNDSYYDEVAQLSPLEKNNIETPNFQAVHDLIIKEIEFITA